ncbi:MAG: nicotinate-nicotinamide nucleotide adenylyltransferase [Candidatus Poribacteria bacterium]|nr:nicotinate-nicotinamide nucleotide adenylyltransferase [Candidatus Poribacteria bacterium]
MAGLTTCFELQPFKIDSIIAHVIKNDRQVGVKVANGNNIMETPPESLQHLVDSLEQLELPSIRWIRRAENHIVTPGNRVGIFSSSFNPMTVAHTKLIELAQRTFQLDEIVLLLAKNNVDKGVFGFSLVERLLMMRVYAKSFDNYSVVVSSHGRFIDKIEALKRELPPTTQFSFIVGYDTLIRIFEPKYYDDLRSALNELFGQCRLIVANRSSFDDQSITDFLGNWPEFATEIDLVALDDFYKEISSSEIRRRLENRQSIDHLVPKEIETFLAARSNDI